MHDARIDALARQLVRYSTSLKKGEKVKLIILVDEDDENEEKVWLDAVSKNPAFDFLKELGEDIYTAADGKPVHEK